MEQRKAENEGVTEDDVNEIKNDISAFRFELVEILRASGMKTAGASGPSGLSSDFTLCNFINFYVYFSFQVWLIYIFMYYVSNLLKK